MTRYQMTDSLFHEQPLYVQINYSSERMNDDICHKKMASLSHELPLNGEINYSSERMIDDIYHKKMASLPHELPSHVEIIYSLQKMNYDINARKWFFSPSWTAFTCWDKLPFLENELRHISQVNDFFLSWTDFTCWDNIPPRKWFLFLMNNSCMAIQGRNLSERFVTYITSKMTCFSDELTSHVEIIHAFVEN